MPIVTIDGHICSNTCLTTWFRNKVIEAEHPHVPNTLTHQRPFVGDNDHAPDNVDRGGFT